MDFYGFGDSFTSGLCSDELITTDTGYVDKIYLKHLQEIYNIEGNVITHCFPGASTTDIVSMYLNNAGSIKKGDIVVLQSTTPERTLIPIHRSFTGDREIYGDKVSSPTSTLSSLTYVQATQADKLDLDYSNVFENSLKYSSDKKTEEELSNIIKDFMQHIVINQWDVYEKYYSNMVRLCAKDVESRGGIVVLLDYSIWFELEEILNVKNVYCGCKHWNDKGHKLVSNLLYRCIKNNISELNKSNLKYVYELTD